MTAERCFDVARMITIALSLFDRWHFYFCFRCRICVCVCDT